MSIYVIWQIYYTCIVIIFLHLHQKLTFTRMSTPQCHEINVMTFDAKCHEISYVGRETNDMNLMSGFTWYLYQICNTDVRQSVCPSVRNTFSCNQAALQMVFSICLSVRLSHLFDYVPIIVSSWNFQELLPMTRVRSMQNVKVKGQGHRGHNPT